MSLFDVVAPGAETVEVQGGGKGFSEGVGMALSAGATGAVISGLGSIYNTFASGANVLGADVALINTQDQLDDIDKNWGKYYKENQNAIDLTGFVGASLIPGTLGIKALNAARAGSGAGAVGRALGFTETMQAKSLSAALKEFAVEGGSVFTNINKNKLAAMAWGAADQTLQAAAFETAVALTMKQSPMLADDSWWDIGKSAMIGAAFGGAIGGGIDALILNKSFKDAIAGLSGKERKYDAISNLGTKERPVFGLDAGDRAFGIIDSLLKLPVETLPEDKILDLAFHVGRPDKVAGWNPVTKKIDVDVTDFLNKTRAGSERNAMAQFETTLRELAPATDVATPFANKILSDLKVLRDSGADSTQVREDLGTWLFNLKGVKAATEPASYTHEELWYFKKALTEEDFAKMGNSVEDWKNAVTRSSPFDTNAYKDPYVFLGTTEQRQQAFSNAAYIGKEGEHGFATLTAAWKEGRDIAFMPDGTLRVNDSSRLWRRVPDPIYSSKQYVNTRSGAFTDDAVLTAADRAVAGEHLIISPVSVRIPTKDGAHKLIKMGDEIPAGADTEYFTARHAWASKLTDEQLPNKIDATDFSLMDRLADVKNPDELMRIQIVSGENVIGTADQLALADVTRGAKLSESQRLFAEAHEAGKTLDVRAVAYQLNVDAQWLEKAVAVRFRENLAGTSGSGGTVVDMNKGMSLPLDIYTRRENLVAEFNRPQQFQELDAIRPDMGWREKRLLILDQVAMTGGQFVTGDVAWAYRVQAAARVNKNASGAVLGAEKASQLLELGQDSAKLADSLGAGASFGGASNANYGDTLRLWAQDTGKKVHLWTQQEVSKVMDALGSVSVKLRGDKAAAAEVGLITNLLRGTDEKYVWRAATATGTSADGRMILKELADVKPDKLDAAIAEVVAAGRRPTIEMNSQTAIDFLRMHTSLNADRLERRTLLNNAKGVTSNMDGRVVYVPPIDTTYFQHFAFVRPKANKAFSTSETSMIFGRNAAELQSRVAAVERTQQFDVISKRGTEEWFKAKDLYDFDRTINEPRINSELRKTGALSNFYPEVRAETVAEDYIRWHQNQSGRLIRDAVETNYAQQFAEIGQLGKSYTDWATSKFAGTTKRTSTEIVNPYDDYLKTALDVSKRSEYAFLHQANEFVDALGVRAYQGLQSAFGDAKKGLLDYNEVNKIAENLGIKGMYNNAEEYFLSNVPRDRNLIKLGINKANMLLANTVLRLDFFNSIVNTVSTPLMMSTELASIKSLASKDPAQLGKLMESLTVAVPSDIGPTKGIRVPSTTKLIAQATANFFGDEGKTLIARYKANGDIKDIASQFHSMIDDLAMRADYKVFSDGVTKAFETGAKFTGNNLAEEFTRFISADVMRQLTDDAVKAGSLSLKEQNAFISVFTNRVQGNYISSQRPIVFQGVLGSAVSLFQTYSFNLMQQLLRHVGNKDKRAVATMFGMQAGLFGLNGTPFFEAVNTHIIGNAAINQGHYDAYSVAPQMLGKEMGDWLMYGTASAMPVIMGGKTPALYTRGDINPRHMTILPMNPMDIPMIDSGKRVVSNVMDMASKIGGGANVAETLLQGLEHNGINRPLAGFAQVMNGKATTSKGSIISASSDFDMISNSARILGSRPMDEAVALNNLYRMKAYQAADRERTEHLGEIIKSHLYGNKNIPEEDLEKFQLDFAKAGGRAENFYGALQRWSKGANTSIVEDTRTKLKTSYGQRLNEIMGGTPLEDYKNVQIPVDPEFVPPQQ